MAILFCSKWSCTLLLITLLLYQACVCTCKLALWIPDMGVDSAVVKSTNAALSSFAVDIINSTQLLDLQCKQFSALILLGAPLLPSVGGPPVASRCDLEEKCIRGLAGTLSWYLTHGTGPGRNNCDRAWNNAVHGNVGPNSTHHTCPTSAGKWHTSQTLYDCVPAVLRASKASANTK